MEVLDFTPYSINSIVPTAAQLHGKSSLFKRHAFVFFMLLLF